MQIHHFPDTPYIIQCRKRSCFSFHLNFSARSHFYSRLPLFIINRLIMSTFLAHRTRSSLRFFTSGFFLFRFYFVSFFHTLCIFHFASLFARSENIAEHLAANYWEIWRPMNAISFIYNLKALHLLDVNSNVHLFHSRYCYYRIKIIYGFTFDDKV